MSKTEDLGKAMELCLERSQRLEIDGRFPCPTVRISDNDGKEMAWSTLRSRLASTIVTLSNTIAGLELDPEPAESD